MGNRANIEFREEAGGKLFFYTHWMGLEHMKEAVYRALNKHARWCDESYLARMIFCELIKDDIEGTTGFGISTYEFEDGSPFIVVDVESQTVTINGIKSFTFEEFITK